MRGEKRGYVQPKLKKSCECCVKSKVKCVKTSYSAVCLRCQNKGLKCVFIPEKQRGHKRPKLTKKLQKTQIKQENDLSKGEWKVIELLLDKFQRWHKQLSDRSSKNSSDKTGEVIAAAILNLKVTFENNSRVLAQLRKRIAARNTTLNEIANHANLRPDQSSGPASNPAQSQTLDFLNGQNEFSSAFQVIKGWQNNYSETFSDIESSKGLMTCRINKAFNLTYKTNEVKVYANPGFRQRFPSLVPLVDESEKHLPFGLGILNLLTEDNAQGLETIEDCVNILAIKSKRAAVKNGMIELPIILPVVIDQRKFLFMALIRRVVLKGTVYEDTLITLEPELPVLPLKKELKPLKCQEKIEDTANKVFGSVIMPEIPVKSEIYPMDFGCKVNRSSCLKDGVQDSFSGSMTGGPFQLERRSSFDWFVQPLEDECSTFLSDGIF